MKRKIIGILAAVVLAGIGTAALVVYVESAKDKAVAAEELVDVYVVSETIPKGTPFGEITQSVAVTEVPAKVVVDDAVTDLDDLDEDLVAAVDLQAGEQLLSSRLVAPDQLSRVLGASRAPGADRLPRPHPGRGRQAQRRRHGRCRLSASESKRRPTSRSTRSS